MADHNEKVLESEEETFGCMVRNKLFKVTNSQERIHVNKSDFLKHSKNLENVDKVNQAFLNLEEF